VLLQERPRIEGTPNSARTDLIAVPAGSRSS
jgi:hypothetical protein